MRIRAVVWECGEGQTDRQTHRHTDGRDQYTFLLRYAVRKIQSTERGVVFCCVSDVIRELPARELVQAYPRVV